MSGPQRLFDQWTEEQKQEALEKMIEIAKRGGHQAEMCIALGIKSEDTFYRWKRDIPEFKAMCEEAKLHSKAFYENVLLQGGIGSLGKAYNATSIITVVNNKFPEEYKRGVGGESSTNNTFNILSIGKDELKLKVQQQLEQLQQFGIEFNGTVIESSSD